MKPEGKGRKIDRIKRVRTKERHRRYKYRKKE
jgi:hypothetical protein